MALTASTMVQLGTPLLLDRIAAELGAGTTLQVSGVPLDVVALAGRPFLAKGLALLA